MAPSAQSDLRQIVDAHLRAYEAWDVEGWLELLAEDVVIVSDLGEHVGHEGARRYAELVAADYGGLRPRLERVVAETDTTIVVELTHLAPDASHRDSWIAVAEIVQIMEVRDGRIAAIRVWYAPVVETPDGRRRARQAGVHRVSAEQSALQRITALVAQGAPHGELFGAVGDEVARLGADASVLLRFEPDPHDGEASVVAAVGPIAAGERRRLDAALRGLRDDGRSRRLDAATDLAKRLDVHQAIAFPIEVDAAIWGAHVVGTRDPAGLTPRVEARIAGFADLIATAISNAEARDELRHLAEEQRALRRVATLVARGTSQREMFEAVAVEASRVMGGDATALFRYEPDGAATVVAVCGLPVALGTTVPANADGVVGEVHRTGRPARLDAYAAADVKGPAADRARRIGVRGSVGVPVVVAGRTWGVLTATSWSLPLPPGTEERGAQFSELVATAISNAESRAELTASRARVVAAGDESRRRILRDLHDGAQQRLVHAIICLKEAQRAYGPDGVPLIDEALMQAERTMAELRDLVHGIMPLALTQGGLAAGIRSLVEPLALPVSVDVAAERLPELVETTAYLIVAEALTNTVKHAQASGARVAASVADGALNLEVSDDGVGGAPSSVHGTGIAGLVDRVGAIGGTLAIASPRGAGTTLRARLPLAPDPAAG